MHTTIRFSAAAVLLLSGSSAAGTIYVNGSLATGANDGSTWADAYRGVDAVAVALTASTSGDRIWVAAGTYKATTTTTRTISHHLKTGVAVYGGFAGAETLLEQRDYLANVTILSGDIGVPGDVSDNTHHVLNGEGTGTTANLDGFTVTLGNADATGSNNDRGGGLLCVGGGSPTIRNSRFLANRSAFGGGAAFLLQSSARFINVTFESNVGGTFGGAVEALSTAALWDRCTFIGNTAARGGAIECASGVTPRIVNCLFRDNVATGSTGGGAIWSSTSTQIRNCTIVENSSPLSPAAGIHSNTSSTTVINCIVVDNTGSGGVQGATNQIAGLASVAFSIVEGGLAGTGNLNVVPGFVNQAGDDFRLTITSPAIDAGNNGGVPSGFSLDADGRSRFADEPTVADTGAGDGPIVDMGAFEFPAPIVTPFCFGDSTGSGCPCGNDAPFASATGCLNSLGTGGLLGGTGTARITNDTFVLQGSGMTNSPCLYLQGTTQLNAGEGAPFGDGLRCAGGTVIRLGTKQNTAGASQYPAGGDPTISVRGLVAAAGSVRTYQTWYRNAAAYCAAETFNLTNGLSVTWEL